MDKKNTHADRAVICVSLLPSADTGHLQSDLACNFRGYTCHQRDFHFQITP